MGYGMLFVIGLVTSVHCIAMCGGINLSQCIPRARSGAEPAGPAAALAPALLYNLGRVVSYTVVGFLLGLAGSLLGGGTEAGLSLFLQGLLKLAAGAFMVIMGVNMLGLFPGLRALTLRPPKFLARAVGGRRARGGGPLLVGLLNGLMPCGPLQSMQLVALASGSPFAGALSMLLFSLGTVPLMLGLGSLVSLLGRRFTQAVTTVGSVLVVVLGLAMLSQGGSLSGLLSQSGLLLLVLLFCILGAAASLPLPKGARRAVCLAAACLAVLVLVSHGSGSAALGREDPAESDAASAVETADGVQEVHSTLAPGIYPNITVQAGIPVRWIIDAPADSINGCNYKMIVQEYGIEHAFQEGENVVEFTPTEAGTYQYSCWMGMIHGYIFVTGADGADGADSADGAVSVPVPAGYQIPVSELAAAELVTDESGQTVQQVSIQLTESGFQPAVMVVQQGVPVRWTIQNSLTTDGGAQLLAPYYSTALGLVQGDNLLSFSPSGSFEVSTGDNAFYAYVKVVEDLSQFDADAVREEAGQFETVVYPAELFSGASSGASCCG